MVTQATLCYIIKYGRILLIKKKKGIGSGLWNGPGGKIEKEEEPAFSASRETYEEVKIVPAELRKVGELNFFTEGVNDWFVHVYVTDEYDGIEKETEEAAPRWFKLDKIPYDEMFPDDRIWMPLMLANKKFSGKFYFDKKHNLISHEIQEVENFE
jgi:8-oxo-dGTP diphosphatase